MCIYIAQQIYLLMTGIPLVETTLRVHFLLMVSRCDLDIETFLCNAQPLMGDGNICEQIDHSAQITVVQQFGHVNEDTHFVRLQLGEKLFPSTLKRLNIFSRYLLKLIQLKRNRVFYINNSPAPDKYMYQTS